MRSPILVDAVLQFEIKGEHIHVTDQGGGINVASSRSVFLQNVRRATAIAAVLNAPPAGKVLPMARRKNGH